MSWCVMLLGPVNISVIPHQTKAYDIIPATTESAHPNQNIQNSVESTWDLTDYSKMVFIPFLCICGCVGNLLNLLILGMRIREGKLHRKGYTTNLHEW